MKIIELAEDLSAALNSTSPAMTFPEIARELKVPQWEIDHKLYRIRACLARNHTPTIYVTQYYFDVGEPTDPSEAWKCCALHGRRAVGLRLQWIGRNDLLGITWLRLNHKNAAGIQSSNIDRITVGHIVSKLPPAKAKALIDAMGEPKIPFHETEFKALIGKTKK